MSAELIQVIRTDLVCRGHGVPVSPCRGVVQFWDVGGELLAECDPVLAMAVERAEHICKTDHLGPPTTETPHRGADALHAALDKLEHLMHDAD